MACLIERTKRQNLWGGGGWGNKNSPHYYQLSIKRPRNATNISQQIKKNVVQNSKSHIYPHASPMTDVS